jgi:hypothetical protein
MITEGLLLPEVVGAASRRSRIAQDLPSIFPHCTVVRWQPDGIILKGKVAEALAFIRDRTADGAFVSDAEVCEHLTINDRPTYRKRIKKHEELTAALDDLGIVQCADGKRRGYRLECALLFGDDE